MLASWFGGARARLFQREFGGVRVITDGGEGQEFQPVFQLALDHIEAIGGDAIFSAAERGKLPFGQVPQGRTKLFASASGELFQIEQRQPGRFVAADALAIKKAKRGEPAILLTQDAIEEFAAAKAETRGCLQTFAKQVILLALTRVRKNLVGCSDAEKGFDVSRSLVIRVKPAGERRVDAFDCVFVGLWTEPQIS